MFPKSGREAAWAPAVEAPTSRIARLNELADQAADLSPTDQERLAGELAQEIQSEPDPLLRAEILQTLAAIPTPSVESTLESGMQDAEPDVRVLCCRVWAERGGSKALEILTQAATSDDNVDVRLAATRGLGELGDPAATATLASALEDSNPAIQYRAVESLRRVSDRDFGNDVAAWREYAQGAAPADESPAIVQRPRETF